MRKIESLYGEQIMITLVKDTIDNKDIDRLVDW